MLASASICKCWVDVMFIDALASVEEMSSFCRVAPRVPKMVTTFLNIVVFPQYNVSFLKSQNGDERLVKDPAGWLQGKVGQFRRINNPSKVHLIVLKL